MKSAPALTLMPNAKNRARNVLGRFPVEGAKDGADVAKTAANRVLEAVDGRGKVEKTALLLEISAEAPGPPLRTHRAVGKKGFKRHER